MPRRFHKSRDWSGIIKLSGIHLLTLIVFVSVFVTNVLPEFGAMTLNLLTAFLCLLLLAARGKHESVHGFGTAVPFMLLILWACMQCIDLPFDLVNKINPATGEIWQLNPLIEISSDSRIPLSLCAVQSVNRIQLFWVAIVIIIATCTFIRSSKDVEKIGRNIVLIAIAVSLLAITQQLFGNKKIYWYFPNAQHGKGGPFVNYSNLGEFLIIANGFGLLILLKRWQANRGRSKKSRLSFQTRLMSELSDLKYAPIVFTLMVVSALAVFLSGGRMALVATVIAYVTTFLTLLLASKRYAVGMRLAAIVVVAGFVFAAIYGSSGRFFQLEKESIRKDQIVAISQMIKAHPLTGIGVGSVRYAYPFYNQAVRPVNRVVGDSDVWYFQLVAEAGLIGMILVASILFQAFRFMAKLRQDSTRKMMLYAFVYIFVGLTFCFMTDFGIVRPGIFIPLAITFGVLSSMSRREMNLQKRQLRSLGQVLILLSFLVISVLTSIDQYNYWHASSYWRRVARLQSKPVTDLDSNRRYLIRSLELGEKAVRIDSRDMVDLFKWLDLKINAHLQLVQKIDAPETFKAKLIECAHAAPAYYKSLVMHTMLEVLTSDSSASFTSARQMLEIANERNQKDRITLIRLSFILIMMGEEAAAKPHLSSLMEMRYGFRVIDLLVNLKKTELLLDILPGKELMDINYASKKLMQVNALQGDVVKASRIYVSAFESGSDKTAIDYRNYAVHLRRINQLGASIESLSKAIRSTSIVSQASHWRLLRLEIYEELKVSNEPLFKQKYIHDYRLELKKMIRIFPDQHMLKKKLEAVSLR